ncbi:MAG TPA: cytochrome P450 [Nocardioides sp.]|nr:cytochrome P450 [Nocardioides sp.]
MVRFGSRTTILNDPAVVADLLRAREDVGITENFLQQRVSASAREPVQGLRSALRPGLRPAALFEVPALIERRLEPALHCLQEGWHDPVPVLESAMSGAVAELYFGSDGSQLAAMLAELLDELSRVTGNPFALPERWNTPVRRRICAQHELLRARVSSLLAVRRDARPGEFGDVADGIVGRARDDYPLTAVADVVIGSLLASQRVPAAAASWLLMVLADHPDLQEQIGVQSGLEARVVSEVLRLFPPTWLLVRTTTRPIDVAGYSFPAGHHFMISPYVLHRDPRSYADPAAFRPDRWCEPQPTRAAYLPFGAGAHICPGRHLATSLLIELALHVTTRYRVVRRPGSVTPDPRTTLLPDGLRISLRPVDVRDQVPEPCAESLSR